MLVRLMHTRTHHVLMHRACLCSSQFHEWPFVSSCVGIVVQNDLRFVPQYLHGVIVDYLLRCATCCLAPSKELHLPLHLSIHVSINLSIHLSIHLSSFCSFVLIQLSNCFIVSIHLSVHLSIYLSIYPSIHISIYLSIHIVFIYPPVCLSIYLHLYLSIYLPNNLSIYLSSTYLSLCLSDYFYVFINLFVYFVSLCRLHMLGRSEGPTSLLQRSHGRRTSLQ